MKQKVVIFAGNHCVKEKESYYFDLAYNLGRLLAQNNFVVASGAGPGLMDEALRGAIETGGETMGVALNLEGRRQSKYVSSSTIFDKLGPRQDSLVALGDAYVALPGGVGTLHEISNILALKRVKEIPASKPLILIGRYYHPLKDVFDEMVADGFVDKGIFSLYDLVNTPEGAIKIIRDRI
jgi:uncharacterized protein (TIGR00730 family)